MQNQHKGWYQLGKTRSRLLEFKALLWAGELTEEDSSSMIDSIINDLDQAVDKIIGEEDDVSTVG